MKNLIIIVVFSAFLIACNRGDRYGDEKIFRYNIPEGITSLDPAFTNILGNIDCVNQLFNGLVQMDEKLKVVPSIAKSWEILDSNKTYIFHLRDDVYYHENELFGKAKSRVVVASDFIFSFNRIVDPSLISPGKWVFNEVKRNPINELDITAPNDTTLVIKLEKAFPPFLGILTMKYCSVIASEALAEFGDDFRSNPIGTGPFQFKYWSENTKLVMLKNSNYFEKDVNGESLPKMDAVSISFIKDQEVAFLLFLKGDLDYLSGLKGSYKDELLNSRGELRPKYLEDISLSTNPYLNTEYIGFLLDSTVDVGIGNPLLNKNLRLAINFGFDREKMLKYLRNGIGIAANSGFVPQGLPSFNADELKGYYYDQKIAKDYLAKAGYPNGEGLEEIVISTTAEYLDICEYMQHQLGEIGIRIKIDVNPPATNNELVANSELRVFRKSWVADYPDAENYLALFKSNNFSPKGPNYTHFTNATYDSLFDYTMTISNEQKRNTLYLKLDSIIVANAPVVPLFYDQVVRFIPKHMSNIGVNPMNLLDLRYAEKENRNID